MNYSGDNWFGRGIDGAIFTYDQDLMTWMRECDYHYAPCRCHRAADECVCYTELTAIWPSTVRLTEVICYGRAIVTQWNIPQGKGQLPSRSSFGVVNYDAFTDFTPEDWDEDVLYDVGAFYRGEFRERGVIEWPGSEDCFVTFTRVGEQYRHLSEEYVCRHIRALVARSDISLSSITSHDDIFIGACLSGGEMFVVDPWKCDFHSSPYQVRPMFLGKIGCAKIWVYRTRMNCISMDALAMNSDVPEKAVVAIHTLLIKIRREVNFPFNTRKFSQFLHNV
jgi:hypothetical protein